MEIKYLDIQRLTKRYEPQLTEAFQRVIASGWFLYGEETHRFEEEFAVYCGRKYALGVANGLDALTLILMTWKRQEGWQDGDEVIVPALTFIASASAVNRAGLKPVFCDVKAEDSLLDEEKLSACLTKRTRALMPVHLYGRTCQMDGMMTFAEKHGLKVIEDCAQAHGALNEDSSKAGSRGNAAAFSFYPGKNLGALGDGGCILSDDADFISQCRIYANYGMKKKYVHEELGVNSRLDELQAACLRVKLRKLDEDNRQRQQIAGRLFREVKNPLIELPYLRCQSQRESIYHVFPVYSPCRDTLASYLEENQIYSQKHYPIPLHKQKAYEEYKEKSFPVSERLAESELSLPLNPSLTEEEITYMIAHLNNFSI